LNQLNHIPAKNMGLKSRAHDDRRYEWEEGKRKGGHILASLLIDKFSQLGGNNKIIFSVSAPRFPGLLAKIHPSLDLQDFGHGLAKLRKEYPLSVFNKNSTLNVVGKPV